MLKLLAKLGSLLLFLLFRLDLLLARLPLLENQFFRSSNQLVRLLCEFPSSNTLLWPESSRGGRKRRGERGKREDAGVDSSAKRDDVGEESSAKRGDGVEMGDSSAG